MPVIINYYSGDTPADDATTREFARPIEAVVDLLIHCTPEEVRQLKLPGLRAVRRLLAWRRDRHADVGGEAGGA